MVSTALQREVRFVVEGAYGRGESEAQAAGYLTSKYPAQADDVEALVADEYGRQRRHAAREIEREVRVAARENVRAFPSVAARRAAPAREPAIDGERPFHDRDPVRPDPEILRRAAEVDPEAVEAMRERRELRRAGYTDREARRILDITQGVADDKAEASLVRSFADVLKGDEPNDAPVVAPGVAYIGRAILLHAIRGEGKTTLLAWLVADVARGGGRVLVVTDDDPEGWATYLHRFGATLANVDSGRAADLAGPGALEKATEVGGYLWVVFDNWRTWGIASGIADRGGFGNTEAAAVPAQRIVDVSRRGPAVTLIANEGYHNPGRSRDSSVVEDAVDATRQLTVEKDRRRSTVKPASKTRVGIDRESRSWLLAEDERSFVQCDGPPDVAAEAANDDTALDGAILDYLKGHPGASGRAVEGAVSGKAARIRERLKTVAERGERGGWFVPVKDAGRGRDEAKVDLRPASRVPYSPRTRDAGGIEGESSSIVRGIGSGPGRGRRQEGTMDDTSTGGSDVERPKVEPMTERIAAAEAEVSRYLDDDDWCIWERRPDYATGDTDAGRLVEARRLTPAERAAVLAHVRSRGVAPLLSVPWCERVAAAAS